MTQSYKERKEYLLKSIIKQITDTGTCDYDWFLCEDCPLYKKCRSSILTDKDRVTLATKELKKLKIKELQRILK